MQSAYSTSVVIPVYNERLLLEESIGKVYFFLLHHFSDFEILIIESGSTDGSKELCDKLGRIYNHVRVIHEENRNGFGSALRIGYSAAMKDLVWLFTVDFPFDIETILKALPHFAEFECVLSYRTNSAHCSSFRTMQSFIFNAVVKFILNIKVRHVNSAFKCYKRDVIQSFPLRSNGWFVEAEILYFLMNSKFRYTEIPVAVSERKAGRSSIGIFSFLSILRELIRFIIRAKDEKECS